MYLTYYTTNSTFRSELKTYSATFSSSVEGVSYSITTSIGEDVTSYNGRTLAEYVTETSTKTSTMGYTIQTSTDSASSYETRSYTTQHPDTSYPDSTYENEDSHVTATEPGYTISYSTREMEGTTTSVLTEGIYGIPTVTGTELEYTSTTITLIGPADTTFTVTERSVVPEGEITFTNLSQYGIYTLFDTIYVDIDGNDFIAFPASTSLAEGGEYQIYSLTTDGDFTLYASDYTTSSSASLITSTGTFTRETVTITYRTSSSSVSIDSSTVQANTARHIYIGTHTQNTASISTGFTQYTFTTYTTSSTTRYTQSSTETTTSLLPNILTRFHTKRTLNRALVLESALTNPNINESTTAQGIYEVLTTTSAVVEGGNTVTLHANTFNGGISKTFFKSPQGMPLGATHNQVMVSHQGNGFFGFNTGGTSSALYRGLTSDGTLNVNWIALGEGVKLAGGPATWAFIQLTNFKTAIMNTYETVSFKWETSGARTSWGGTVKLTTTTASTPSTTRVASPFTIYLTSQVDAEEYGGVRLSNGNYSCGGYPASFSFGRGYYWVESKSGTEYTTITTIYETTSFTETRNVKYNVHFLYGAFITTRNATDWGEVDAITRPKYTVLLEDG